MNNKKATKPQDKNAAIEMAILNGLEAFHREQERKAADAASSAQPKRAPRGKGKTKGTPVPTMSKTNPAQTPRKRESAATEKQSRKREPAAAIRTAR